VGAGARGDLSAANPARNGEVGPIERGAHSLAAAVLRVAGERPNGDGFFIPVPARPAEDARCGSAPCTSG